MGVALLVVLYELARFDDADLREHGQAHADVRLAPGVAEDRRVAVGSTAGAADTVAAAAFGAGDPGGVVPGPVDPLDRPEAANVFRQYQGGAIRRERCA